MHTLHWYCPVTQHNMMRELYAYVHIHTCTAPQARIQSKQTDNTQCNTEHGATGISHKTAIHRDSTNREALHKDSTYKAAVHRDFTLTSNILGLHTENTDTQGFQTERQHTVHDPARHTCATRRPASPTQALLMAMTSRFVMMSHDAASATSSVRSRPSTSGAELIAHAEKCVCLPRVETHAQSAKTPHHH